MRCKSEGCGEEEEGEAQPKEALVHWDRRVDIFVGSAFNLGARAEAAPRMCEEKGNEQVGQQCWVKVRKET